MRRPALVITALALLLGCAVIPNARADEPLPKVPNPRVIGPVLGGLRGHPFAGGPFDYASRGYVEEEYFISGTARAIGESGSLAPGADLGPAPFETRIVVRRPANAQAFNGTAIIEWFNVTEAYDIDTCYTAQWEEAFRGYAWISVSAQLAGHSALRAWDPQRYGRLVHPGDAYANDIFAQAAKAVREPLGNLPPRSVDPMGGLDVERVIGCGNSQSGNTVDQFINTAAAAREPVFDGYQVQASVDDLHVMADERTPILRTFTENEIGLGTDQPDSEFYRQWDFGSSAHADDDFANYERSVNNRDFGTPIGVWPTGAMDITPESCMTNAYPKNASMNAALHSLDRWIRTGTPPKSVPRVVLNEDGSIKRDQFDNALGGVRLPAIEVPIATYYGDSAHSCPPGSLASLAGQTVPFSVQTLHELYPTKHAYQTGVARAVATAEAAGVLLKVDGDQILAEAERFDWIPLKPRPWPY